MSFWPFPELGPISSPADPCSYCPEDHGHEADFVMVDFVRTTQVGSVGTPELVNVFLSRASFGQHMMCSQGCEMGPEAYTIPEEVRELLLAGVFLRSAPGNLTLILPD